MRLHISVAGLRLVIKKVASPHYYSGRSPFLLLIQNFLQLVAFFRTPRPTKVALKETKRLRNSATGKSALILGAGPSANKLNVNTTGQFIDDIFVINGFNALELSKTLKPSFYGLSDPAHFANLKGERLLERNQLIEYVTNLGARLVLPHTMFNSEIFRNSNPLYFDDRELHLFNRNISPLRPRSYCSNTIYKMLALACFMGYEKIYIIGIDNTNFYNYRGRIDNRLSDIGGNTADKSTDSKSSLIEDFEFEFTSGISGRMQSYAHLFGDLRFFPKDRIINLDEFSLIDAFHKVSNHPLVKPVV